MAEPLTREAVLERVRKARLPVAPVRLAAYAAEEVTDALLATAQCAWCDGSGRVIGSDDDDPTATVLCWDCRGTGLDQSRLAAGLAVLEGVPDADR